MELTHTNLKNTLESYGFSVTEIARSEKIPYDTLFIGLGEDYKSRPWILNIRLFEQDYDMGGEPLAEGTPTKLYFLNFFITLPFTVFDPAFADLSRLILMLNKIIPVPGFGMSEMDKVVYYQYTYPSIDGKLDPNLLLSMIAFIIHYINTHVETFEEVATRVKSLKTVLEESEKIVEKLDADFS